MPPLSFTIVTPSLNQAAYIEDAIRSVARQGYPAVEHIVVDGGSRDGTREILKKYPHLRSLSEPDRGQSHALNKGFAMATGDILGWLNADDYYCDGVLPEVARCFQDPSVMVVYGDGYEVGGKGEVVRRVVPRTFSTENLVRYWKWRYDYVQPSFFFRRTALLAEGPVDESLEYAMDHELFIRLSKRYRFTYLPLPLSCFRVHPASKTGSVSGRVLPVSLWEMHRVSMRHWGAPAQWSFYDHLFSFTGAVLLSVLKNALFVRGSKSRARVRRFFHGSSTHPSGRSNGH
jgi:glycosyltransferase involved in cell wall biosynthesis